MAGIIATNASTTQTLDNGDVLYVPDGVLIGVTTGHAVSSAAAAAYLSVAVDGALVSASPAGSAGGIAFSPNASAVDIRVTVGDTGSVRSVEGTGSSGIYLSNTGGTNASQALVLNAGEITGTRAFYALYFEDLRLENSGLMAGMGGHGVFLTGAYSAAHVVNSGEISGRDSGVLAATESLSLVNTGLITARDDQGVWVTSGTLHLVNAGVIAGAARDAAAAVSVETGATDLTNTGEILGGVLLSGAGDDVRNDGVIEGTVSLGNGLNTYAGAGDVLGSLSGGTSSDRISNDGRITASLSLGDGDNQLLNGGAVGGTIVGGEGVDEVVNHGRIDGPISLLGDDDVLRNHGAVGDHVYTGGGADRVVNRGAMDRDVSTGDAADVLRNFGEIGGDVDMGDTADTVVNRGVIAGDVQMGQGNDAYRARKGGEVDGRVQGGDNNDTLIGSSGDETFEGGGGFDTLKGRAGDDVLRGGAGDDLIVGGLGDDVMTGGINADVFRIGSASGDDEITDWEDGVDVLDLRALNIEISTSVGDVKAASQNRAGGLVIIDLEELGGDGSLTVSGWNVNLMTSDDFVF